MHAGNILKFNFYDLHSLRKHRCEQIYLFAAKPNVTVNCSKLLIVNEGDDVICHCKCEGGNPPAECTWYKNGAQIGVTEMEVNMLFLRNFNGQDRGSYTCVGQSHVKARDEKSVTVTDFCKYIIDFELLRLLKGFEKYSMIDMIKQLLKFAVQANHRRFSRFLAD